MTDDEELRWKIEVLRAQFEDGKVFIAEHLAEDLKKSLMAIKNGPDGKVDLSTVDGRVRSLSLVIAHIHQRDQAMQQISLREIQEAYFGYIEANFGWIYKEMLKGGYDANQYSYMVSQSQQAVDELTSKLSQFIEGLVEFWDSVADAAYYHIQDMQTIKGVYGGDLFPSYSQNIASSCGLYLDTIVLSDPFIHSRHIFENETSAEQARYLIKHALSVLSYKELALADVDHPIIVIVPNRSSIDDDERNFLGDVAKEDALRHAEALFMPSFSSFEELLEFGEALDEPGKIIRELRDQSRLLFDDEWTSPLEQQIVRAVESHTDMLGNKHPGRYVVGHCFGRMGQATDILFKSRYLGGTPLIDAPTSWKYFGWKLEYNAALSSDDMRPMHMVKGLQHAGKTDLQWLGNIPPDALIEIRREGAMEEIREMLSSGIEGISETDPSNFFRVSDQIYENVNEAFEKHQENVREMQRKGVSFAGKDIGSWFALGAIELAAIAVGAPSFGAAAFAANQVIDAPKLKEIPSRFRTLRNAQKELKKSPMGLLFRHKS